MTTRPEEGYEDLEDEVEASFPATSPRQAMPDWYPELLASVSRRVAVGRSKAIAAANQEVVATYWAIGRDILERQGAEGYGTKVIDRLSADLRRNFPEARGFSPRNLKYMRAFASSWSELQVVQAPLAQLPWYHQIALMEKLKEPDLRLGTPSGP